MPSASSIAAMLVEAGVVRVDAATNPASPAAPHSALFVDVCRLLPSGERQRTVLADLIERVQAQAPALDVIVSPNVGALPLATLVASALGLPMVYLRPRAKSHGRQRQVEGTLPEHAQAVIVYDTLSDGATVGVTLEIVQASGAEVAACAALVAADQSPGEQMLRDQSIPLVVAAREGHLRGAVQATANAAASKPTASSEFVTVGSSAAASGPRPMSEDVARALLNIGAVSINGSEPFRYASGLLSPIYTDNRLLISHPDAWQVVVAAFADLLDGLLLPDEAAALAGAPTAGVPHATRVAERTNRPLIYVEEQDGVSTLYGSLAGVTRVVIVEDLVTTGRSVLEYRAALRQHGASADTCVAIFTYNVERAAAVFTQAGMEFAVLCDLPTLLDVALRERYISERDRDAVVDWVRDPQAWTDRAEERLTQRA